MKAKWTPSVILGFLGVLVCLSAQAAQSENVNDWIIECSDGKRCIMEYNSGRDFDSIKFQRGGQPNAPLTLTFHISRSPLLSEFGGHFLVAIDGQQVMTVQAQKITGGPVGESEYVFRENTEIVNLLSAMNRGHAMTVVYDGPQARYELNMPLSGVKNALLAMDKAQGRLKRLDALYDKGDHPLPSSPWVEYVTDLSQLPSSLRDDFEEDNGSCRLDVTLLTDKSGFILHTDKGISFTIMRCGLGGAYNQPYAVYVEDNEGVRRLSFPGMDENGPAAFPTALNVHYDEAKKRIVSFAKSRGMGDSGAYFVWSVDPNRERFTGFLHLIEQRQKNDWDNDDRGGPQNWPLVWPMKN